MRITDSETPMQTAYKPGAPKRPTNLSLNSDLLRQARELDINLSQVLEQALDAEVRKKRAEQWLQENRVAIAQYNADIELNGVFSDGLRSF
jgi:antitoxin CcdA